MQTYTQVSSGIRTHGTRVQAVGYTTDNRPSAQDIHTVMKSGTWTWWSTVLVGRSEECRPPGKLSCMWGSNGSGVWRPGVEWIELDQIKGRANLNTVMDLEKGMFSLMFPWSLDYYYHHHNHYCHHRPFQNSYTCIYIISFTLHISAKPCYPLTEDIRR